MGKGTGQDVRGPTRFFAGDPLRGIGAAAVVTWHVAFLSLEARGLHGGMGIHLDTSYVYGHPFGELLRSGALAITMFFALSGYLIARPFVRAYVLRRKRPPIRRYALNRLLRIYPVFLVVALIAFAIYGLDGASWGKSIGVLMLTDIAGEGWTFRLAHTWSLTVELAFYGALPIGYLLLSSVTPQRVPPAWRAAILGLLVTALGAGSLAIHWTGAIYATLPGEFWSFVPGVLLAVAEPFAAPRLAGRARARRLGAWAAVAGLVALLAFLPFARLAGGGPGKVLTAVGCLLVIGGPLAAQWAGARPWRILDNAPLRWLGERSYPIYMIHWVVGIELAALLSDVAIGPKKHLLLLWVLMIAATIPLAALLHRFVERPALERKLAARDGRAEPAGAPAATPAPAPQPAVAPAPAGS